MRSRVALCMIAFLLIAVVVTSCGGEAKPAHYGVFLKQGKQLAEIVESKGQPSQDASLLKATDSQPMLLVWLPDLVLDYVVMRDQMGDGDEISFTAKPTDAGIIELQPKESLAAGIYCLIKGDPLGSPSDTPYYCFQVGGSVTVLTTVPAPVASLPPTPNPMAHETDLAAAATAVMSPANAATQAAAEQVLEQATATAEAAEAARLQSELDKVQSADAAGKACTRRVRSKVEAGDYSDIRPGADLSGCDLHGLNLFGLDFSGVNLSYANLMGANLKNAKFNAESNLDFADLGGANLEGVDLANPSTRLTLLDTPLPAGARVESVIRILTVPPESRCDKPVWVPTGAMVYCGGELYDATTGLWLRSLKYPNSPWSIYWPTSSPVFSSDGKLAALHLDDYLRSFTLIDVDTGSQIGGEHDGQAIGWTQDGRVLVQLPSVFRIWDPKTDKTVDFNGKAGACSPDEQQIVTSTDSELLLWNAGTGTQERTLIDNLELTGEVILSYSGDGRWLAVKRHYPNLPDELRVVSIDTGVVALEVSGYWDPNWSPTGARLAARAASGSGYSIWAIASESTLVRQWEDKFWNWASCWEPQGNWFVDLPMPDGPYWGMIRVTDANDGTEKAFEIFPYQLSSVAISPDGETLALAGPCLLPVKALLLP